METHVYHFTFKYQQYVLTLDILWNFPAVVIVVEII